jgi:hypothetical protein
MCARRTNHQRGRTSTPFALSLLDDRGRPEAGLLQPPLQLVARLTAIGKDIQQLSYLPRNLDTDISYDLQSADLQHEGDQRCQNASSTPPIFYIWPGLKP